MRLTGSSEFILEVPAAYPEIVGHHFAASFINTEPALLTVELAAVVSCTVHPGAEYCANDVPEYASFTGVVQSRLRWVGPGGGTVVSHQARLRDIGEEQGVGEATFELGVSEGFGTVEACVSGPEGARERCRLIEYEIDSRVGVPPSETILSDKTFSADTPSGGVPWWLVLIAVLAVGFVLLVFLPVILDCGRAASLWCCRRSNKRD